MPVPGPLALPDLIRAFYSSRLFRVERGILALAGHRSTAADLEALATGGVRFAAWEVAERTPDQILLRDVTGRTCSWLMVREEGAGCTLWFGSAVIAVADAKTGKRSLGPVFHGLLSLHLIYSRALLSATRASLKSLPKP